MPLEVRLFSREDEVNPHYKVLLPGQPIFIKDFSSGVKEIVVVACNPEDDGLSVYKFDEDDVEEITTEAGDEIIIPTESILAGEEIESLGEGGEYKRKFRNQDGSVNTFWANHLGGLAHYYVQRPN